MGGQKTIGIIHNEAFNFVKKNYVAMLVITLIMRAVELVLGSVSGVIMMPFNVFSGIVSGIMSGVSSNYADPWNILPALIPILRISGIVVLLAFAIGLAQGILYDAAGIGARNATLQLIEGKAPSFEGIWGNFAKNWKRYIGIIAWMTLWQLLWSLLFIVPGIVKMYSYRLAPYIVLQYPDMKVKDALKKSIEMTDGYKGRLFGLDIILIGYGLAMSLLCCLVIPLLGFIFWLPLLQYGMYAIAYLDLKQAAIDKGLFPPDPAPHESQAGGISIDSSLVVEDSSSQH